MLTPIAEGESISTQDAFYNAWSETDDGQKTDLASHLGLDQQIDTDPISNYFPLPSDLSFLQYGEGGDDREVCPTAAESS